MVRTLKGRQPHIWNMDSEAFVPWGGGSQFLWAKCRGWGKASCPLRLCLEDGEEHGWCYFEKQSSEDGQNERIQIFWLTKQSWFRRKTIKIAALTRDRFFIFQCCKSPLRKEIFFVMNLEDKQGHTVFLIIQKAWENLTNENEENLLKRARILVRLRWVRA